MLQAVQGVLSRGHIINEVPGLGKGPAHEPAHKLLDLYHQDGFSAHSSSCAGQGMGSERGLDSLSG